jgi:hypothetical protein
MQLGKPVLEGVNNKDNNMTTDPLQICSSAVLGRLYYTGQDGVVATRYGLEGPGMESRCGRSFLHPPRPALSPSSLLYNVHVGQFKSGRGVVLTTHTYLAPRLNKE